MAIRKFESSRPSQAVWQLEIVPLEMLEMPTNGGLLQIYAPSLNSKSGQSLREDSESLRPHAGKFPFSGDRDRRLGSICTAWQMWAANS
jgi:hypothetical protein